MKEYFATIKCDTEKAQSGLKAVRDSLKTLGNVVRYTILLQAIREEASRILANKK